MSTGQEPIYVKYYPEEVAGDDVAVSIQDLPAVIPFTSSVRNHSGNQDK